MKIKTIVLAIVVVAITFTSCKKEQGCTDSRANNFSVSAEEDDGSCYCASTLTFDNYTENDYTIVSSSGNTWVIASWGIKNIDITGVGDCYTYTVYDSYGGSNQTFIGETNHCACDRNRIIDIN